jgi:hypothetical protein
LFHATISEALKTVLQSIQMESQINMMTNNHYFKKWVDLNFTGEETFEDVTKLYNSATMSVWDYVKWILHLPLMSSFVTVQKNYNNSTVIVSITMTITSLKTYCAQNIHNSKHICLQGSQLFREISNTQDNNDSDNASELVSDSVARNSQYHSKETEVMLAWKTTFYNIYQHKFETMKNTTLIEQSKYDHIVKSLQSVRKKQNTTTIDKDKIPTSAERRFNKKYRLKGNMQYRCLRRKLSNGCYKLVPTYEEIFSIMSYHHNRLSHTRDLHKNKRELDKVWYKIPESCIKIFLNTCPYCFPAKNPSKSSKMQPLNMIFSERVGHRAQIDLIGMESQEYNGCNQILRYVDHLSGFSHVAVLRSKESEEVGLKLIQILATAMIPEILQSDNGSEFLGDCIQLLKEYYPEIHIVKGRPRRPQTQGKVERGHAHFKENLQKWMQKSNKTDWTIGAYVVNAQMNQITQQNRGDLSPYNMYYGSNNVQKNVVSFGEIAAKKAKTEYGVLAAKAFCAKVEEVAPDHLVTNEQLLYMMNKGKSMKNNIYDLL